MAKVYSSEFGDTAGWVLVNDYTIHEAQRLKDRPFMRTRVPKSLHADLLDVRVAEGVEWAGERWADDVDDDGNLVESSAEKERKGGYELKRAIHGRATFKDTITIFAIDGGAVSQFRSLGNVRITPLPRGMVGGKHKATTFDGISFSGMSSRDVPAGGLMEGEPGKLWLDDGKHEPDPEPESLNAELYLDEDKFNPIFEALRDGVASIDMVRVSIAAELFEGEVQASLSERWMAKEYGMLKKGDWVQTRARLDSIHVGFGKKTKLVEKVQDQDESFSVSEAAPQSSAADETQKLLGVLIRRSGWILAALAALLVATLLK